MDYIPTKEYSRFRRTLRVVNRVSKQLIAEKRAALLAESTSSRDIFSVLGAPCPSPLLFCSLNVAAVQANVSQDPKARLSDEELVAQMASLVLAGHITTATTLTWLFHELSCHQGYQAKMREEISQARVRLRERGVDDFGMEELEGMPLVLAAVKVRAVVTFVCLLLIRRVYRKLCAIILLYTTYSAMRSRTMWYPSRHRLDRHLGSTPPKFPLELVSTSFSLFARTSGKDVPQYHLLVYQCRFSGCLRSGEKMQTSGTRCVSSTVA